jgi:hypothetical protein
MRFGARIGEPAHGGRRTIRRAGGAAARRKLETEMFDDTWVQAAICVAFVVSFLLVFELTRRSESKRVKLMRNPRRNGRR